MSIQTAIESAQQRVADAYTAISNKGGTLPATQNLANMPTAIGSIPTSSGSTKYGVGIDSMLGSVDANGVMQMPDNTTGDIVFTGVKDLVDYALDYKFYYNSSLTHGVSFPDLEGLTGNSSMQYAFCFSKISSVSLPKLKTVSGNYAATYAFSNTGITSLSLPELETVNSQYGIRYIAAACAHLTSISVPKLKTVSNSAGIGGLVSNTAIATISLPELTTASGNNSCSNLCQSCLLLETAYFPKLSDVSGSSVFLNAFYGCKVVTDIYFNALTTTSFGSNVNQFNNMFSSGTNGTAATSGNVNVHFPSNLSSTIAGLSGYPNFGATSGRVTLLFDLTATS